MIKHIVLWTLKDSAAGQTKAENAWRLKEELEALPEVIDGIGRLEVGVNFETSAEAWDVALYSEFATREALIAYQSHPAHLRVGEFVALVKDKRAVVDYEV